MSLVDNVKFAKQILAMKKKQEIAIKKLMKK